MVFNKKNINFNKEKKKNARVKRKELKLDQKHKNVTKKLVSGARTKKSLRKQAHKERVSDKVALTLGDEQMGQVSKSSLKRRNPKKKGGAKAAAAAGAGAAAAAADAEVMQE